MKGVKSVSRRFFLAHGCPFVIHFLTIHCSSSLINKKLFSIKNLTEKISFDLMLWWGRGKDLDGGPSGTEPQVYSPPPCSVSWWAACMASSPLQALSASVVLSQRILVMLDSFLFIPWPWRARKFCCSIKCLFCIPYLFLF